MLSVIANCCRDEKDKWIRAKYEFREFLPPLPYGDISLSQVSDVLIAVLSYLSFTAGQSFLIYGSHVI